MYLFVHSFSPGQDKLTAKSSSVSSRLFPVARKAISVTLLSWIVSYVCWCHILWTSIFLFGCLNLIHRVFTRFYLFLFIFFRCHHRSVCLLSVTPTLPFFGPPFHNSSTSYISLSSSSTRTGTCSPPAQGLSWLALLRLWSLLPRILSPTISLLALRKGTRSTCNPYVIYNFSMLW